MKKLAKEKSDVELLEEYRKRMKNHVYSDEKLFEMRAAFGEGVTVVDIITGEEVEL